MHARGIVTIFNPFRCTATPFHWTSLFWLIVNQGEGGGLLSVIGGDLMHQAKYHADDALRVAFSTLDKLTRALTSTAVVYTLGETDVFTSMESLKEMFYLLAATLQGDVGDNWRYCLSQIRTNTLENSHAM